MRPYSRIRVMSSRIGSFKDQAAPPVITPVAEFTGTPLSGTVTFSANFTDNSTNTPTSWLWEYKVDAGSWTTFSTSQNPSLSITSAGSVSVRLTATNAAGSNTRTRTDYIVASAPAPSYPAPWAYYPLSANSNDASGNGRNLTQTYTMAFSASGGVVDGYTYPSGGFSASELPGISESPGSYTIAAWMYKPSTSAGGKVRYYWGGDAIVYLSGTLTMPGYTNSSLPDATWFHAAVTNSSGSANSYYNGSSVGSGSLSIGGYRYLMDQTDSYTYVVQRMCEVALWKGTALTALEIADVYAQGDAGLPLV